MKINRRNFVKNTTLAGLGAVPISAGMDIPAAQDQKQREKKSPQDSDRIRLGFIGVGNRGRAQLRRSLQIGKADIIAICDVSESSIAAAKKSIAGANANESKVYTGSEFAFMDMLENENLDAVIVATPWEWHARMAVAAMKAGVCPGVEVPACTTLDESWDLVNTHEETGVELMFFSQSLYSRESLAILNMVRQNLFGELLHCRCGYLHDLRGVKFNDGVGYDYVPGRPLKFGREAYAEAQWRGLHSIRRNGDLYPIHGIAPIAKMLDIHNGNRFLSLSSFATKARGLGKYVEEYGGIDHPLSKIKWNCGDIVTTTINCANGETVLVTHNCNNPRPKQTDYLVQGTKGLWSGDWKSIYIEEKSPASAMLEGQQQWEDHESYLAKYDHKFWRSPGKSTQNLAPDPNIMILIDFFDSVINKKPAAINAYDAAAWSAIAALSEMSIAKGNMPVDFPDFTRGRWIEYSEKRLFAPDEKFPVNQERYLKY
jgi:hypothetical protein